MLIEYTHRHLPRQKQTKREQSNRAPSQSHHSSINHQQSRWTARDERKEIIMHLALSSIHSRYPSIPPTILYPLSSALPYTLSPFFPSYLPFPHFLPSRVHYPLSLTLPIPYPFSLLPPHSPCPSLPIPSPFNINLFLPFTHPPTPPITSPHSTPIPPNTLRLITHTPQNPPPPSSPTLQLHSPLSLPKPPSHQPHNPLPFPNPHSSNPTSFSSLSPSLQPHVLLPQPPSPP